MRIRVGLAVGLALSCCALPAHAARDLFVRDSPRSAVATCLRPTGAPGLVGMLGPLERRMSPYDLLRVSADGVAVAATARLGIVDECPAVAADPAGHAIVAGAVRRPGYRGAIRAALAEPGGGFGPPVDLTRIRTSFTRVAAAVSPRGDAVVAWTAVRGMSLRRRLGGPTRVMAALRPAGGTFGRPQALTPWRRGLLSVGASVSAGMDASGTATLSWTQPIPDRRNIPDHSTVEAAAAPAGGPFGPAQVIARRVQDVNGAALSVAPNGRALLAHDGQGAVQIYERSPGESRFARVRLLRPRRGGGDWQLPDVALAPDGAAVVAWRGDLDEAADVLVASRRGTGAWTAPQAVHRRPDLGFIEAVIFAFSNAGGGPSPPLDLAGTDLSVALGSDGRYLVGWGMERELPLGDRPVAARVAPGLAGARAASLETAGCTCRSVAGVVPLALPRGDLVLAYTDNVGRAFGVDGEFPVSSGRLHVAELGPPGDGPAPPDVSVRRPRRATLDYGDGLRVRVACDGACDLRAYVLGRGGRARGLASGSLRAAGSRRLALTPNAGGHLAPPSGRARVVVHGYAPNGRRFVRRSVPVELRRRPLPPLPRPLNVSAVRRGRSVVVTWQMERPARRVSFQVAGRGEEPFPLDLRFVRGRNRLSFRVRLRNPRELHVLGEIRRVAVSVVRGRPPFDDRTTVVPVTG